MHAFAIVLYDVRTISCATIIISGFAFNDGWYTPSLVRTWPQPSSPTHTKGGSDFSRNFFVIHTMVRTRVFAEEWLKINDQYDFFEALHTCGYLIDCWAMSEQPERTIRRFLPARVRAGSYVEFTVPKKTGDTRSICAPVQPLKEVQRALGAMLQALFRPSEAAMGFVAGIRWGTRI